MILCQAWRSGAFLVASVLGLARLSSADCSSSSDTLNLNQTIPSCALACVEEFISTQYASGLCCDGTSLSCLCKTNTTSGLTLGEGALACTVGSCSSEIIAANSSAVYEICNGVSGALPETHSAITATRYSVVTETSFLTSTTVVPPASVVSVLPSGTSSASMTSSDGSLTSSLSSIATTTSPLVSIPAKTSAKTSASTSTAAAATHASSALGSPAVIGVSVASGVSGIFLVGVLVFFCGRKLRRKRLNAEAKESFEIGGRMSEPPEFTAAALRESISRAPGEVIEGGAHFQQFPSQPLARQGTTEPEAINLKEIGNSPDTEYGGSPQSQTSQHTLSRLLPEKTSGMVPEPLRVIRKPVRPLSEATEFDEEEQRPDDIFGPPLEKPQPFGVGRKPENNQEYGSPVRAIGLPADPRPRRHDQMPYNMSPYSYKWDKSPASIPRASRDNQNNLSPYGISHSQYNSNGNTPLQRNFSRLGRDPHSFSTQPNTPRSTETAADTSYETIQVEDDWTEKSKLSLGPQLTPVQEKAEVPPLPTQPPARYPAVPRSAAIVPAARVPRRSQAAEVYYENRKVDAAPMEESFQTETTESNGTFFLDSSSRSRSSSPGSRLLAKRRGETVADEMESQFRTGVQPRYPSASARKITISRTNAHPSRPYGPPGSGGVRSPPQAHNITPTRLGDDLYLRVD